MRLAHALLGLAAGSAAGIALDRDARADEDPPAAEPATTPAPAGTPSPAWDFEIGGKAGYTSPPIRGGTTPFGAGFGGRAGFAFSGMYLGLSVVDYLGGKDVDVTDTAVLYGAEVGYGVRVVEAGRTVLTLRAQVGAGGVSIFRTDPSTSAATTSTGRGGRVDVVSSASGSSRSNVTTVSALYVEPGLTTMLAVSTFFVAVNGNTLVIPGISYSGAASTTWLAYGLQGQTGFVF